MIISVNAQIGLQENEISMEFVRASGPGGQNVNKLNTKALLRWPVMSSPSLPEAVRQRLLAKVRRRITSEGDLLIVSQRFRDAGRNVADCLEKLRELLREAAQPPKSRKATRPTQASRRRRLEQKQRRSRKKQQRRLAVDE